MNINRKNTVQTRKKLVKENVVAGNSIKFSGNGYFNS